MMGLDNPLHIVILLVILLLVFGAKRLPELGRSLGTGMRSFKESISGEASTATPAEELSASVASPASSVTPAASASVETLPTDRASVRPVA